MEKAKKKEKDKKQLLLRVSSSLWEELARWAEDDFRSINGQIEYLLTECVKRRKKANLGDHHKSVPDQPESGRRDE